MHGTKVFWILSHFIQMNLLYSMLFLEKKVNIWSHIVQMPALGMCFCFKGRKRGGRTKSQILIFKKLGINLFSLKFICLCIFSFNHVNAYEDGRDNINVDIVCYRDDTIAHQLTTQSLRNPADMKPSRLAPSEVRRYVLSSIDEETISFMANNSMLPTTSSITSRISSMWGYVRGSTPQATNDVESSTGPSTAAAGWYATLPVASYGKLAQPSIELPQVNPLYKMHSYKYLYGLGFSASSSIGDGTVWDAVVKMVR